MMFTDPALKWYVAFNTHNPRRKTFHLKNWDISLLLTQFSLLFQAQGSESHISAFWGLASLKMFIELFTQNWCKEFPHHWEAGFSSVILVDSVFIL